MKVGKRLKFAQKKSQQLAESNITMLAQLLTIAKDPEGEKAKQIISYYKQRYDKIKDGTINPNSDNTGEATAVPEPEAGA